MFIDNVMLTEQGVEHVIMEVQRPDSRLCTHNKKHEMTERNIQTLL